MACHVSAMTSCLQDICARLHRRAWCASGSTDVPQTAPVDVGALAQRVSWAHTGTIRRRRVAILKWVSWRVLVGPNWARAWTQADVPGAVCSSELLASSNQARTLGSQVSRWFRVATALTTRWTRDWPPVSPPNVRSAGVRRSVSKASTSKAAERASVSLIKSSRARVRRSALFCSFIGVSAAVVPPILAAWRRCSSFHKPHPPRSAGLNKASFFANRAVRVNPEFVSPLSGQFRRRMRRTPSSSPTRALEEDGRFSADAFPQQAARSLYRWEASRRVVSDCLDVLG